LGEGSFIGAQGVDLPNEADSPQSDRFPVRIVHVHVPKTAGSALAEAFQRAYGNRIRVYPPRYEMHFNQAEYAGYNFFTGHIGAKVANEIGGDFITILRDPVDRFLSTYFFLRQLHSSGDEVSHKTSLAMRYDLDQFTRITEEPALELELRNRMTWQIAYSHRLNLRRELIATGIGDADLVRLAISNLSRFKIVGIQTNMAGLAKAIRERYQIEISIGRVNVTRSRLARNDLSLKTLDRIEKWVDLDQELYNACTRLDGPMAAPVTDQVTGGIFPTKV